MQFVRRHRLYRSLFRTWRGTREGSPEERARKVYRRRIPKVAGSGRHRVKLWNIAQFSQLKKGKESRANKNRAGTGIKGNGKREV